MVPEAMSETTVRPLINTRAKISFGFLCSASLLLALVTYYCGVHRHSVPFGNKPDLVVGTLGVGSFVLWLTSFLTALIGSARKDSLAIWVLSGCFLWLATAVLTLILH